MWILIQWLCIALTLLGFFIDVSNASIFWASLDVVILYLFVEGLRNDNYYERVFRRRM